MIGIADADDDAGAVDRAGAGAGTAVSEAVPEKLREAEREDTWLLMARAREDSDGGSAADGAAPDPGEA